MTTIVPGRALATAMAACAACLDKDTVRHSPGRTRITRTGDAVVLETASRTGRVRMSFRIPCDQGDPWVAEFDAESTARLARALRAIPGGRSKKAANGGGAEIERTETALVVSFAGQRVTVQTRVPAGDEPEPPGSETRIVADTSDLASRIAAAMPFCAPGEYRDVAKGPFAYFRGSTDGHLVVPVVVATDGHRLYVDGDARDSVDAETVLRVPGDIWPSAAKALDAQFETVRLVRTAIPSPASEGEAAERPADRHLDHMVFESADREVRVLLEQPLTSLPRWAGFVPRESGAAGFDVVCDKAELARAMKMAATGSRLSAKSCMLRALPERGLLRVRSADLDGNAVELEVEAVVAGASRPYLHLNPKYVLDALGAVGTGKVRIRQAFPPLDPVRILEVADDGSEPRPLGLVVMPVRGNDPPEEDEDVGTAETETEEQQPAAS